jgi:hypothetical protein
MFLSINVKKYWYTLRGTFASISKYYKNFQKVKEIPHHEDLFNLFCYIELFTSPHYFSGFSVTRNTIIKLTIESLPAIFFAFNKRYEIKRKSNYKYFMVYFRFPICSLRRLNQHTKQLMELKYTDIISEFLKHYGN